MNPDQKTAWEFILKQRDFYGTYHNHKETMAYVATAFYLGGMWAVIFSSSWHDWPRSHKTALAAGIVVATALAVAFVLWQFQRRIFGADMVGACTDLATIWLTEPPDGAEPLRPRPLDHRQFPAALVDHLQEHRQRGPWLPRELTLMVILLGAIAAIARIVALRGC